MGFTSFWLLPNGVASARFLKPEERECAIQRLCVQGGGNGGREQSVNETRNLLGTDNGLANQSCREETERFAWSEVARGVFNWQTWLSASAYFGILSGLYSFGLFVCIDSKFATRLRKQGPL